MISSLRDRILHFKLYGHIDAKMSEKVHQAFKGKGFYNVNLIAVSINSGGGKSYAQKLIKTGSLVQAKNIVSALKHFSRQKSAPVYCFAEDLVLNSANLILAGGNKCYANKYSLIGDFGYSFRSFGLKEFIKDWKIDQSFISSGDKKVRLNQFEDLKPEDAKWIKNILSEKEFQLQSEVIKHRQEKFSELKLKNEEINKELFNVGVFQAEHAVKMGLVDGINSLDNVASTLFHGIKVIDAIKKSFWEEELAMVANFTQ